MTGTLPSDLGIIRLRAFISGLVAALPLSLAAVGWASHWNAYSNLMLTLGGLVVLASGAIAAVSCE